MQISNNKKKKKLKSCWLGIGVKRFQGKNDTQRDFKCDRRRRKRMEAEKVKGYLENSATIEGDGLPLRFFERLIMHGLSVDLIETGRVICSFRVPPRLLNGGNYLHGGVTATLVDLVSSAVVYTVGATFTGTSVEINVSFLDAAYADVLIYSNLFYKLKDPLTTPLLTQEEIEIEARALRVGKAVAVLSVEFRNKNTGKIIAQGRHTKYLHVPSKM